MVVDMVRCHATDAEGYRCVLNPSHDGPHRWGRCEATDAEGFRCMLPPGHPGGHELAWFARPTAPGATRTTKYRGKYEPANAQALKEAKALAAHNWYPVSQHYVPSAWAERFRALGFLWPGELVVVYEYKPSA